LLTDEPINPTPKDIFRLRSYFYESIPRKDYVSLLYSQINMHTEKLTYLNDTMVSTYPTIPAIGTIELGDYMVLEGAIIREKAYIQWLYRCLSNNGESIKKDLL
jgi:hypothetical protein